MNTSRVKKNTKEELISRGTITCSLDMQNKTTATLHQPHKNIFLVRILVPLEKHKENSRNTQLRQPSWFLYYNNENLIRSEKNIWINISF